jgi:hypothetical protein
MKNTLVRAFVLSLAVAGFGAASVSSKALTSANVRMDTPRSSPPAPLCLPSDPTHCGMDLN